jgi:hypothetical protein
MARRISSLDKITVGISRDIASQYDNVKLVAENIDAILAAKDGADKLLEVPENVIIGRTSPGVGDSQYLTPAQTRTLLNIEDGATADQTGAEIVSTIDTELGGATWRVGETNLTIGATTTTTVDIDSDTGTNATIPQAVASVSAGLLNASDKAKLDGIEAGATGDQTGAEIKLVYEAEADTNAFTDAEKSKLGAIEANAKDDQVASEVPFTSTGTVAATNVQAAIAELGTEKAALTGATFTGDVTVPNLITTGTVDGRDVSTDGGKLDGIEVGATADQTGSEIKTLYEAEADTNAYTDAEKSKLAGIEVGATQDQSAAEVEYSNTTSGRTSTDVQGIADELAEEVDQIVGSITVAPAADSVPRADSSGLITPQWIDPNKYPTLVLDFATGNGRFEKPCVTRFQSYAIQDNAGFDSIVTFTRATTGTYYDANGVLQTAAIDEPRFDHDPATGEQKGLLIEEGRTNLLTHSEAFDNAVWSKDSSSITPNAAVSPTGEQLGDKIVEDAGAGTHGVGMAKTLTANTVYTMSFYVKAAERTWVTVGTRNTSNWAASVFVSFNLVALTANSSAGAIVDVGNGWRRVSVTALFGAADAAGGCSIYTNNGSSSSYTGDGTSGLYVWGAQLEVGSFPTSYIPTTSAEVTRALDDTSVAAPSPWLNRERGTFFTHCDIIGTDGQSILLALGDSGSFANNRYQLDILSSGPVARFVATSLFGVVCVFQKQIPSASGAFKIAASWDRQIGQVVLAFNGTSITGTTEILGIPNTLTVGKRVGATSSMASGWSKVPEYYPFAMTQAELEALTS